jgi:hypothetical protein
MYVKVSILAFTGARCYVETLAGGPNTVGVTLLNSLTNSNGIASCSYYYGGDQPILVRIREPSYPSYECKALITRSGATIFYPFTNNNRKYTLSRHKLL